MVKPLTEWQKDALTDIINIGVGRGAATLNTMCRSFVRLSVPTIEVIDSVELAARLIRFKSETIAAVTMPFSGNLNGLASILFPPESASNLVTALTGEDPVFADLDSIRTATLNEMGNIIINGVLGAIGNILQMQISYSVPTYVEDTVNSVISVFHMSEAVIVARARFQIEEFRIEGDVLLLFEVGSFSTLISGVESSMRHDD